MKVKQTPKTIATINFKGGVGKTTMTWCLGDYNQNQRTIFHAIAAYASGKGSDFAVDDDFIYKISSTYHFVPSVEYLYWLDIEDIVNRKEMRGFIQWLLGKITWSKNACTYQYALFDCPPSFSLLTYSVLSCCNLILIPVNPDFYAAKGVSLILRALKTKIAPFPLPKIAVFMNKAKLFAGGMTKGSIFYWNEVKRKCDDFAKETNITIQCFDTTIYERPGIKQAVSLEHKIPDDFIPDFKALWNEIERCINE